MRGTMLVTGLIFMIALSMAAIMWFMYLPLVSSTVSSMNNTGLVKTSLMTGVISIVPFVMLIGITIAALTTLRSGG